MPVGGSVSASALNKVAGARSRQSLIFAEVVMAILIVALGDVVGCVAMPALAGLLMLIGYRTIKPANLRSVWRTGAVQKTVLVVTFVLTMMVPLQYAVLVSDGHLVESDPPTVLPGGEGVVLQPYGSPFFAAAPVFEGLIPQAIETSRHSVVILRLRGRSDLGSTALDVLHRYAASLAELDSRLVLVSTNERIDQQLTTSGITDVIGPQWIYRGDERVGATLQRAEAEATAWVASQQGEGRPSAGS